ncbi:hypothetical protein [Parashewanella curva]|nr:hypothetical protein [Parashewanella curva]
MGYKSMPIPFFLIGGAVGALALAEYKQYKKDTLLNRIDSSMNLGEPELKFSPSLVHSSNKKVVPTQGAIVCCHVYGLVCHVGIWCDDAIIELHGSGLVRVVSTERFLKQRSGETIYVACNNKAIPISCASAAERAKAQVYYYREYELLANNCYRFIWYCLSGQETQISSFTALNEKLANYFQQDIYWDELLVN